VPPPSSKAAIARRWFAELRELRDRLAALTGLPLSDLSMGMSDDYEAAIAEGATIVRLGRAVFGARQRRQ
jgi:PLP dependent protein